MQMDPSEFHARYQTVMASDLVRDGMWLELSERMNGELVMLAFYSDYDGTMEFEKLRPYLPADVAAWFREQAFLCLPPSNG